MMEIQRAVRTAVEAGTKHHIGDFADRDQIVHRLPVARIIFEIGVLDHEDVSGECGKSGLQPAAFAFVALVEIGRMVKIEAAES